MGPCTPLLRLPGNQRLQRVCRASSHQENSAGRAGNSPGAGNIPSQALPAPPSRILSWHHRSLTERAGREALSPCPALLSPDPKPRHEPPGSGNLQVLDPSPFPGGKQRNHPAPELGRRHLQGREGKPGCPQHSGGFIFHSRQVGMVKGGNLALLVLPEGQGIKFQLGGWRAAGEASEMVVEVRKECSKGEK